MPIAHEMRRNDQIRISPVRVIADDNEQLGVLPINEALQMAQDAGLDLVEVAANVRPPVCRIMDYGKWKYNQKKRRTKKAHEQTLKEVRLRPKTDDHDRSIKVKRAAQFLENGDKVQFTMRFRGRERAHREIAFAILRGIADEFGERVKVERAPSMDGRNMVMILAPVKGAWDTPGVEEVERSKTTEQAIAPVASTAQQPDDQMPTKAPQPAQGT